MLSMNAEAVRELLEPILRRHLGPYGFERAEVRLETEFYGGDPVWDVDLICGPGAARVDQEARSAAHKDASDTLLAHGDTWFPHLRHKYTVEPKAA